MSDKESKQDDVIKEVPNPLKADVTQVSTAQETKEKASKTRSSSRIVPSIRSEPFESGKTSKVLVWRNLVVGVPIQTQNWCRNKGEQYRTVLDQVSGVAEPGEILAIMGESGAGKTTLLNVLTQRNVHQLHIQGVVEVNGEQINKDELKRMSAYVQQQDLFLGPMTVKEHLIFTARLRMGRQFGRKQKMDKVDELIEKVFGGAVNGRLQMGLVNCKDTMIGQRFQKSISLGEKKRLAFASELITDPSIMFCDEPTSGLDAYMAKQVVLALTTLAKEGKTVVITIHQPSSQIFEMFHKWVQSALAILHRVCFMGMGKVIYLGPTTKVTKFLTNAGYPMADYTNPAEHAIRVLAVKEGEEKDECLKRVEEVSKAYENSSLAEKYQQRIHGPVSERRFRLGNRDVRTGSSFAAPWYTQLWFLLVRAFTCILRDPLLLRMTAVIVGIIYFRPQLKRETILTYDGIMFNSVRDMNFMFLFPCILAFTEELPLLLRESSANVYRAPLYFIAKNMADLPQYIMLPVFYSTVVYLMTGVMPLDAQKFFTYTMISIAMCNTATSLGYAAACIFGTAEVAVQLLPLYTLPLFIFGGFFVKLSTVPVYFNWMKYISWYRYAFESHMINMWHDSAQFPGSDGPSHLHHNGFADDIARIWFNMQIMLGMILIYKLIGLVALWIRCRLSDR